MEKEIHKPVLLEEVIDNLDIQPSDIVVDATFGFGGHSREMLKHLTSGKIIGIEKDVEVLDQSKGDFNDERIILVNDDFGNINEILGELKIKKVDKTLFDLGISSYHFDSSGRGFTFKKDEPLDMRLDKNLSVTAADLVNGMSRDELADLFYTLADEGYSRQIAKEIVETRHKKKFETTFELAQTVARVKRQTGKIHPATKVFQALRIAVNNELEILKKTLPKAIDLLNKNGRIAVISFHSGEDRIVKNIFKTLAKEKKIDILTKKPIVAQEIEIKENPRSRSAKFRVVKRRD